MKISIQDTTCTSAAAERFHGYIAHNWSPQVYQSAARIGALHSYPIEKHVKMKWIDGSAF